MNNAIPFEDWLEEQGDNVFVAISDVHPDALILIDKTDLAVYRYTIDGDVDGLDEAIGKITRVLASGRKIEVDG